MFLSYPSQAVVQVLVLNHVKFIDLLLLTFLVCNQSFGMCGQCQPSTSAGSDNGINNILLCVEPPTLPP